MKPSPEPPILSFPSQQSWEEWLSENQTSTEGIWLRVYKKASGISSVTYQEALDEALCYGWIDGQKKPYDETSWLQRFVPRRPRSGWSKRNREHVARLTEQGKMRARGIKEVEQAKADGRWDAAYDSPSTAEVPEDFQRELDKNQAAGDFFAKLNRQNRYAILYRIQNAKKPETREKRMREFIEMLEKGENIHP